MSGELLQVGDRMRPHTLIFALIAVAGLFGCDLAASNSAPAIVQCPTCAGTGRLTASTQAPLPGRVDCDSTRRATGILGLGRGQIRFQVVTHNDGDSAGSFEVSVRGRLESQSHDQAVALATETVYVQPHASATSVFELRPNRVENLVLSCHATAPIAIQESVSICPVCGGGGTVRQ